MVHLADMASHLQVDLHVTRAAEHTIKNDGNCLLDPFQELHTHMISTSLIWYIDGCTCQVLDVVTYPMHTAMWTEPCSI
jgi:hypothetical protein